MLLKCEIRNVERGLLCLLVNLYYLRRLTILPVPAIVNVLQMNIVMVTAARTTCVMVIQFVTIILTATTMKCAVKDTYFCEKQDRCNYTITL